MSADEQARWRALLIVLGSLYDALDAHGLVPIETTRDALGEVIRDGFSSEGDTLTLRRVMEIHQVICQVAEQRRGGARGRRASLQLVPAVEEALKTETPRSDAGTLDGES